MPFEDLVAEALVDPELKKLAEGEEVSADENVDPDEDKAKTNWRSVATNVGIGLGGAAALLGGLYAANKSGLLKTIGEKTESAMSSLGDTITGGSSNWASLATGAGVGARVGLGGLPGIRRAGTFAGSNAGIRGLIKTLEQGAPKGKLDTFKSWFTSLKPNDTAIATALPGEQKAHLLNALKQYAQGEPKGGLLGGIKEFGKGRSGSTGVAPASDLRSLIVAERGAIPLQGKNLLDLIRSVDPAAGTVAGKPIVVSDPNTGALKALEVWKTDAAGNKVLVPRADLLSGVDKARVVAAGKPTPPSTGLPGKVVEHIPGASDVTDMQKLQRGLESGTAAQQLLDEAGKLSRKTPTEIAELQAKLNTLAAENQAIQARLSNASKNQKALLNNNLINNNREAGKIKLELAKPQLTGDDATKLRILEVALIQRRNAAAHAYFLATQDPLLVRDLASKDPQVVEAARAKAARGAAGLARNIETVHGGRTGGTVLPEARLGRGVAAGTAAGLLTNWLGPKLLPLGTEGGR